MADSITNLPLPGQGPNDYEMQPGNGSQAQAGGTAADADMFGQHMLNAGEQVPAATTGDNQVRQFASNNPFSPEAHTRRNEATVAGARDADATAGPGVDGHNVNVTNRSGQGLKFGKLSGPDNSISNQGKVRINEIAEGATLNLSGNGGDVRVKFNNGRLQTQNNTGFIGVNQNNGELAVEENKGTVKVKENGPEGDTALGRKGVAGISQGGFPGYRHSGRVDIATNHGTFEQHYGNGSLGQALNLNRTSEVHRSGEVHAQPSGPGGKLHTPVAKGAGLALGATGVLTTIGVGAANWEGTYTNSKGLAHPTMPHPSSVTPTVAVTPGATVTSTSPTSSPTPHSDEIARSIGLDPDSSRAAADTAAPHESAPKIRI